MKIRIDIDTRTFVRFWLVVIGFALLALLLWQARTALMLVGVSAFLAIALSKPVAWLAAKLPGKSRLGATALAFTAIVVIVSSMIFLVIPPILEQTARFADTVPSLVDRAQTEWYGLQGVIDSYNLQPQIDSAVESIKNNAQSWAANIGQGFISGIGSALSFLVAFILVVTMTFLMLLEGPTWVRKIWLLYKDKQKMADHKELLYKMYNVVTNYVNGQLTVSAIGAMFAGAAVFILGLFTQAPTSLAAPVIALTFVLTLIPMFGSTIAGILGALLLLLNDIPAGVIYAIYFVIYQQIENNLIAPVVQSRTLSLSPLTVLVAATVGIYMLGLAGAIIAIPVAGCINVLLERYVKDVTDQRVKNDKPVRKLLRTLKKEAEKAID